MKASRHSIFLKTARIIRLILVAVCQMAAWSAAAAHQGDAEGFGRIAHPYLKEHCIRCHGPEKSKGKLRVDTMLPNTFLDGSTRSKWAEVLNAVNSHEMPPEDEPQPDPTSAGKFTDWVTAELGRAEIASRSASVVLRRLNRTEYNNTVSDLFHGLDFRPADRFTENCENAAVERVPDAHPKDGGSRPRSSRTRRER